MMKWIRFLFFPVVQKTIQSNRNPAEVSFRLSSAIGPELEQPYEGEIRTGYFNIEKKSAFANYGRNGLKIRIEGIISEDGLGSLVKIRSESLTFNSAPISGLILMGFFLLAMFHYTWGLILILFIIVCGGSLPILYFLQESNKQIQFIEEVINSSQGFDFNEYKIRQSKVAIKWVVFISLGFLVIMVFAFMWVEQITSTN